MVRHAVALITLLAVLVALSHFGGAPAVGTALAQDPTPTPAPEEEDQEMQEEEEDEPQEEELNLITASVSADLVQPGRVLMSARGNHWIYDSVPPINGPNEEVNPLDALVGALPACGIMVYEAAARENDILLDAINATVEADFDPRGVAGANVNPRIRAFRVTMNVSGPSMEEAEFLAGQFRTRCPIYTTLERSAPIEITNVFPSTVQTMALDFVHFVQAGMPEQDVHVVDPENEGQVRRVTPDMVEVSLMGEEAYATAEEHHHDMFMVSEVPLGPFEQGRSLGFTIGDWLTASGSGTYSVSGDQAEVDFTFEGLVPNGVYTLWCSFVHVPPNFSIDNYPCGAEDGTENIFTAGEDGSGSIQVALAEPKSASTDETISLFAVAYHSDGNTYGPDPGQFSLNSHVQLFAPIPPAEAGNEMEDAGSETGTQHTVGTVVTHPATGAMEPIEEGTADLFTTAEGATARMHTVGLTPGNVYTAWWVIANNPKACDDSPCSPADFLSKTDEVQTEVTYADGIIVGPSGEGDFAAFLPAGEVTNNPWFGHHFPDPTVAEIHLVLNDHGPLIPEMAENMVNTYRGGCSDESLPPPFPDTAKADGEPGPNTCALVQAAVYQQ